MNVNPSEAPLAFEPDTRKRVPAPIDRAITLARLAALQRAIAAGRTTNASVLTDETALGYDEHGLPT
jgi:hypothetical protein